MLLADYVVQVIRLLEQGHHFRGEILLERGHARRWADCDDRYDAIFSATNPD